MPQEAAPTGEDAKTPQAVAPIFATYPKPTTTTTNSPDLLCNASREDVIDMPNLDVNLSDTAQRNVLLIVRDMESRPPTHTTDLGGEAITAARELAAELYRELVKVFWVDELEEALGL